MNREQAQAALERALKERDEARIVAEAAHKRVLYWQAQAEIADRHAEHTADTVSMRERVLREARLAEKGGWHPQPSDGESNA